MYPREYFDTYWRGDLKNEVFVIMSFAPEFQPVWEQAIKPAIEIDTVGTPFANRVDATVLAGSIITDILEGIAHAKLVFADISVCTAGRWEGQRNGNAMYELGLAHALRRAQELVVVRSDHEQVNFDIAAIRIQDYNLSDLPAARKIFSLLLNDGLKQIDQVKHLKVTEAVERLEVETLHLMSLLGKEEYFPSTSPKESEMENFMQKDILRNGSALRHLLSLDIIRFDPSVADGKVVYRWTEFGKAVLSKLGIL